MVAKNFSHEHICHDCGMPLDVQHQSDGKGGSYIIVTCWNPQCLLRTVTRSLTTYSTLTDSDWEAYREMNRTLSTNPAWYSA
jgi:hypothetical protein